MKEENILQIVFAKKSQAADILSFYEEVIKTVNRSKVKLGWDTSAYPDISFIEEMIENHQMLIVMTSEKIVAAAAVNHHVNAEYDLIDWDVKEPKEHIATIHALATAPGYRGGSVSDYFLAEIEKICKDGGDKAIHLDVIDTNFPAYKLYIRNGYREKACIKMYYESVGTREFWMMEKVL